MSMFERTKLKGKIQRNVGNNCARKRSKFLRVCQFQGIEPEKLMMESPEVGNNDQLIFNNWNKNLYKMVQKIGRKCPEKMLVCMCDISNCVVF